jgi:hypothetical protein
MLTSAGSQTRLPTERDSIMGAENKADPRVSLIAAVGR